MKIFYVICCGIKGLGEGDESVTKTLGGNIMEMLSKSFFMSSSIGDLIKDDISSIVTLYNLAVREGKDEKVQFAKNRARIKYICENMGDDFLRKMLTGMVEEIAKTVNRN